MNLSQNLSLSARARTDGAQARERLCSRLVQLQGLLHRFESMLAEEERPSHGASRPFCVGSCAELRSSRVDSFGGVFSKLRSPLTAL